MSFNGERAALLYIKNYDLCTIQVFHPFDVTFTYVEADSKQMTVVCMVLRWRLLRLLLRIASFSSLT